MAASLEQIAKIIQFALNQFNDRLGTVQKTVLVGVQSLLKDLKLNRDGTVANAIENLRIMNRVRTQIQTLMMNPEYLDAVKNYASVFSELNKVQNAYFQSVEKSYTPSEFTEEMRRQMIDQTVSQLGEQGIGVSLQDEITELLRTNITTGSSYESLSEQLRSRLLNSETGDGALVKYAKQIVVDSTNQYAAQNMAFVAADLGYEWYRYAGFDIATTRPWCDAMTDREYFHVSEIPALLKAEGLTYTTKKGETKPVPIYPKTGLPGGMIEGTNQTNIFVRRGGYQCGHQILPLIERLVPETHKNRVYNTQAYKDWAQAHGKGPKSADPKKPAPTPTPPPTPPKPAPKSPTPAPPKKGRTVDPEKEARKTVRATADASVETVRDKIGMTVKLGRVATDITPDQMKSYLAEIDRLASTFDLSDAVDKSFETKVEFISSTRAFGFVKSYQEGVKKGRIAVINFGHKTDSTSRIYIEGGPKRSKSRVDPDKIGVATVTHEFFHVITNARGDFHTENNRNFWREMRVVRREYIDKMMELNRAGDPVQISRYHLGNYANTNDNEFGAEAFTEWQLASNPSPFAVKVGNLVNKYFKK